MPTATIDETIHTLFVQKDVKINAPVEVAYQALLAELGPDGQMPDGTPYPLKLEAWPGGRWFRDLGNNTGHFWGHVQVIKPPPHPQPLIEIIGPMFMSYPAASHLQYRLVPEDGGTRLTLTHRAFGWIPQEHREGVQKGWGFKLDRVKEIAESRLQGRR